jgi:hypothetical protein
MHRVEFSVSRDAKQTVKLLAYAYGQGRDPDF